MILTLPVLFQSDRFSLGLATLQPPYWFQAFDPRHRTNLKSEKRFWKNKVKGVSFLEWLDANGPFPASEVREMKVFNPDELGNTIVVANSVEKHKRVDLTAGDEVLDGDFLFVIAPDFTLRVTRSRDNVDLLSFYNGAPVIIAGTLTFRDGQLQKAILEDDVYKLLPENRSYLTDALVKLHVKTDAVAIRSMDELFADESLDQLDEISENCRTPAIKIPSSRASPMWIE